MIPQKFQQQTPHCMRQAKRFRGDAIEVRWVTSPPTGARIKLNVTNGTEGTNAVHDHELRCESCHQVFDLMKAEVGGRTMENTLGELPDHNNPWVKCPHCGYVN